MVTGTHWKRFELTMIDIQELPELPENYTWRASIRLGRFKLSIIQHIQQGPNGFYDTEELDYNSWELSANTAELVKKVLAEAALMKQSVLDSVLLRDAINKQSKTNKSGVEINGK